ncbi:MAG: pyruvate kinase alpha/beta domain-containing protein [Candidatus Bathyarchaeota archaeon]|nr:pyruvate kinase alpha/beta domain-containing protein [Candidatus Bathyarchaeota archaeon]NLD66375.1 hypothetical protein [Thermoproteota archaeon]
MGNMICKTVYFDKTGPVNTLEAFKLAKHRAEELGVKNIVVSSSTGETGVKAVEFFKGYNLVVVTYVTGFSEPNIQKFKPQNRVIIESNGGKILTTTHAFGTLGRAVNNKFGTIQVDGIVAAVLRLFGQGTKVGCEIVCMAADAGLIRTDEDAITLGGTGQGVDTALVLRPSNTHNFFDLAIKEVICKPHL